MSRHFRKYRGLLVIVLWQAAPVGIDEYGRTRIGFGLGRGTVEFANFDCEGELVDAQTVGFTTAAVEAEHWLEPGKFRLHGAAGYEWSDSLELQGPFGALLVSYERRMFGIGGGVALTPGIDFVQATPIEVEARRGSAVYPSAYARFGNRDRMHVRIEVFNPSVQTPSFRLLLGYNQFASRKPSGAIGYGVIGLEGDTEAFMVDYFHPVSPTTALGVSAYGSPGHEDPQAGLTLRARITIK